MDAVESFSKLGMSEEWKFNTSTSAALIILLIMSPFLHVWRKNYLVASKKQILTFSEEFW